MTRGSLPDLESIPNSVALIRCATSVSIKGLYIIHVQSVIAIIIARRLLF